MRVLYFHQHFSTPKGSAGIRSYEMAKQLLARGHQVTMVCGSYRGGETGIGTPFASGVRRGQVDGIDIIEFDLSYANHDGLLKRAKTFMTFALKSVALVFREPYDLVFATTTPLTASIPGIFSRWFRGKPFVFEVRDLWPELPRAMGVVTNPAVLGALSFLEWLSYHSAHRLIGLSPGIVEGIHSRGVPSAHIAMVPNGCDLDIFAQETAPWRPDGVAPDDLLAVFAGTHGMANGLDKVLDAASVLKRRGRSDIKILLVGQGKLKAQLQQRAQAENLDNVIFHEPVNKQKLAGLLAGVDVGMQILANVPAFYYGTSPNKFFDYIAAGLPVLNNYPGWLAELIRDNTCGFSVPPDDAEAFADALEAAAADRAALKTMGVNSRLLARKQFDRALLSNRWVDWLEHTLATVRGKG